MATRSSLMKAGSSPCAPRRKRNSIAAPRKQGQAGKVPASLVTRTLRAASSRFGRLIGSTVDGARFGEQGVVELTTLVGYFAMVCWVMNVAREAGIHYLACGHYATEVWGVRAVAEKLARETGTETVFVEVPTGL